MAFWTALIVSLVLTIAGELLRPKQNPQNAKASGLDDFSIPTAEEGRSIPIFCGKVKVNGANVVAYGDLGVEALTRKVKTGMFSSKRQTYAYRYSLGMQMALAHGDDTVDIHEIHFGESMPRHTRINEGNGCVRFDFNDPNFYGGDEKEGGVVGTLRFYIGSDTQNANPYLAFLTKESAPAYRGLAHAMLEKMYLGTSQYIKTVSYVVSRYPNGLGMPDGKHKIADDCNPVCFVYELLTNQVWGVGLQGSDIDQVQFRKIGEILHTEGYGVSLLYNGGSSAKDIVSDIMRHIDGVMFSDPETGLVSIRIARKDYIVEELPVYGPDDFLEGIDFARPSWLDTKNLVKTSYIDRAADYTTAVISQQDLANISQRGGEVSSEDLDFTGFSSYGPAALATARALKTLSYPLARVSGELSRKAWKTKPADVFVLNWPELGIDKVVFRVTRVNYGGTDRNSVGIEAVEDIFAISDIGYVQPPPSTWVNPLVPPQPLLAEHIVDMPYGMEPTEGSVVATFGWRSNGIDEGYVVESARSAPFLEFEERARVLTFTPFAFLANPYPATRVAVDSGFELLGLRGTPDVGAIEFALIISAAGQEWISYSRIDGAVVGPVTRGVFDTPPVSHPAGAQVFFASSGYGRENEGDAYLGAHTIHARLLPYNARGTLAPEDATTLTLSTNRRGSRPYPPGRVRVNNVHPQDLDATVSGDVALAWAARNRFYPSLPTQDDPGVPPEEGTSYVVRARREDNGAILASGSGTLTSAVLRLTYAGLVRVQIEAVRDGLASFRAQEFVMAYSPGGAASNEVIVDSAEYVLDGGGAGG